MNNKSLFKIFLIMAAVAIGISCISAISAEGTPLVGDGDYVVGKDLPAGEYYVKCNSYNLYVEVASDPSRAVDKIVYNLNTHGGTYITLEDGQYLRIQGGDLYKLDQAPDAKPSDGKYKEGMFKVGEDIPAGEYKIKSTEKQGYYEIATDSGHKIENVVKNDNFDDTASVKLEKGQYITLTNGAEIDADAKDTSAASDKNTNTNAKNATTDNKQDTASGKAQQVTLEGITYNIPAGFSEDKSMSHDNYKVENPGKANSYITERTYKNSAGENFTISTIVYENAQTNDELASQLGPSKTVNGVKGYAFNQVGNGFAYVKDGKLAAIVGDDKLLEEVVVK